MEEQVTKKYDPAVAEKKYQEKLFAIKNTLARYTTEKDKGNFYDRNKNAIEKLARGDSYTSVSDVMTGFRKLSKPDETYDARIELQYFKNKEDKWAFSPRFHFKNKELIISPTMTLPTSAKHEYAFNLNECKQNKLEATVNIGGENVKLELTEADLTELSNTRELSRVIKSNNESKYEYKVTAKLDANRRSIDKLTITQNEKIQLPNEDVQKLTQSGRLDKLIAVGEGVNERKYFVAVDRELNKLAFTPTSAFDFLNQVKVVKLSPVDITRLSAGQQVTTTLMKGQDAGKQVITYLDPVRKNLKVEAIDAPKQEQKVAQKVVKKATPSAALKNAQEQAQLQMQEQAQEQTQTQTRGAKMGA